MPATRGRRNEFARRVAVRWCEAKLAAAEALMAPMRELVDEGRGDATPEDWGELLDLMMCVKLRLLNAREDLHTAMRQHVATRPDGIIAATDRFLERIPGD